MTFNLDDLKKPLPPDAIEWRISRSGTNNNGVWATAVTYKTSRADMDRLDEVVGPENWQDEYKPGPNGGVICGISIHVGDEWVTKWDGADNTNFEGVKGGLSDAFKRAGFKWGIGRYLYQVEEAFVETSTQKVNGWNYQSAGKSTPAFYWKSPDAQAPASKPVERKQHEPTKKSPAQKQAAQSGNGNALVSYKVFDTIVNSDGILYKDIPVERLGFMANSIMDAIKKFGDPKDDKEFAKLEELNMKLDAAKYYMGAK